MNSQVSQAIKILKENDTNCSPNYIEIYIPLLLGISFPKLSTYTEVKIINLLSDSYLWCNNLVLLTVYNYDVMKGNLHLPLSDNLYYKFLITQI